jgi:hypothetical protein
MQGREGLGVRKEARSLVQYLVYLFIGRVSS